LNELRWTAYVNSKHPERGGGAGGPKTQSVSCAYKSGCFRKEVCYKLFVWKLSAAKL